MPKTPTTTTASQYDQATYRRITSCSDSAATNPTNPMPTARTGFMMWTMKSEVDSPIAVDSALMIQK